MTKPTRRQRGSALATSTTPQPDLFERPAGIWFGFASDHEFRQALGDAISASGLTRGEVAERMERLLGSHPDYTISEASLNAWCAPSRTEWRMPATYLLAFIHVVGAEGLLRRAAHHAGLVTYGGDDAKQAELGRKLLQAKELAKEIRRLETQMGARR